MRHTSAREAQGRDPALVCLALLFGLGGLACLSAALHPPNPYMSVPLNSGLGILGITSAAVLVWVADQAAAKHLHRRILTAGVALNVVMTFVLMWRAGTQAGQILTGFNLIYLTMVTAYFHPRRTSRAFVAVIVLGVLAVTWFAPVTHVVRSGPVIGAAIVMVGEVLGSLVGRIRNQATIDDLTGALNRSALREAADRALSLAQRSAQPLTLLILDLDGFKVVNDEQGHAAGDALLAEVAGCWRDVLRSGDVLARVGGDEFVVLLSNATLEAATTVVHRMRAVHPARWSYGIATSQPDDDLASMFSRADKELYAQKALVRS